MEYVLLVYLNNILTGLMYTACIAAGVLLFISVVLCFVWAEAKANSWKAEEKHEVEVLLKRVFKAFLISLTFSILIPSEDTRKLMLAVYIGDQIANTEEFQETAGKAYDLLQDWLDEALEEESE